MYSGSPFENSTERIYNNFLFEVAGTGLPERLAAAMKRDIKTRKDIKRMVDGFYDKVRADDLLGPVFDDIAKVNWERHLPMMYDFWDNTIFFSGAYTGNPMHLHQHLHERFALSPAHFDRWTDLFNATVDDLFSGENALLAKQRAASIAAVIQSKILPPPTIAR